MRDIDCNRILRRAVSGGRGGESEERREGHETVGRRMRDRKCARYMRSIIRAGESRKYKTRDAVRRLL